jgi:hypothetical protein
MRYHSRLFTVSYSIPSTTNFKPSIVYLQGKWKNNPDNMELQNDTGAVATAIAGIVYLYMPLSHPRMLGNLPIAAFFIGSGIAQIFWILPMVKRWGKPWYYIGILGNVAFIILYVITRLPGNLVNGRGGDIDMVDMICELAQVAYITITAVILARERTMKVAEKEQLR